LDDGKQAVYDYLDARGVAYKALDHAPVYTIEEMEAQGIARHGNIAKNLFLRDDKGKRHFLVVLGKDKKADLAALRGQVGARLSFASEERLARHLGVGKGAVTPFGLLNDRAAAVEVFVDRDFVGEKRFGCHPNDNAATVFLAFEDVLAMMRGNGNAVTFIDVPAAAGEAPAPGAPPGTMGAPPGTIGTPSGADGA